MSEEPPEAAEPAAWKAVLLTVALSVLPHLAALVPGRSYYFRDFSVTFYPLRLFQARELAAGRWPSWNPYIGEGAFAFPILYPLDLLHVLWPGPAAVSWLLTLHFPLAAAAAYLLCRDLGARRTGAAAGGAAYALGGLALSSLNLYVFLQALALAPLVALALRRAALAGGRAVVMAALTVALAVTTLAVEFVAQAALLGLALGLVARRRPDAAWRQGLALLLGAGLAAVPVLVVGGVLGETARGPGFPREVALSNELHPVVLLQALVPNLMGELSAPVEQWWGGRFYTKGFPYFLSIYTGALALALCRAGWSRLDPRLRLVLCGAGLLGIWYALGDRGGLAPLLLRLPGLSWFRFPSKALLLPHLAVAVLVALGADALRERVAWRPFVRALAVLLLVALLPAAVLAGWPQGGAAWAGLPPGAGARVARASLAAAVPALAGLALAGAVLLGRVPARRASLLVSVLLAVDLAYAGAGMNPQVDARFFDPLPEMAALRLPEAGRTFSYGPDHSPAFRRFLASGQPGAGLWAFFVNRHTLAPYTNVIDRVETAEAKDITGLVPRPPEIDAVEHDPAAVERILPRLRNAAVTRVVTLDALAHPDLTPLGTVATGHAQLAVHVYALERSWPRVAVACRALVAGDRAAALAAPLAPGFEAARDVVLEAPVPAGCSGGWARSTGGTPALQSYAAMADGGEGVLVTRESYARGWQATLDGRPVPVLRANGKHRAVALPPGPHQVVFRYVPPGLALGAWVMAAAAAAAGLLWVRAGILTRAPAP